jgi:hypothetical protein
MFVKVPGTLAVWVDETAPGCAVGEFEAGPQAENKIQRVKIRASDFFIKSSSSLLY